MGAYLDRLDDYLVPAHRLVLAALGPRMLKLAARRSASAHPYLTTPEHTAQARQLVGDTVFLAPEHKVLLSTDAVVAYGTPDQIAAHLDQHLQAGADHVAIQVLGGSNEEELVSALSTLAHPLGLTPAS